MNGFKVASDAPIDALRRTLMLGVAGAPLAQLTGCGGGSSGSGSAAPPLVSSPTPGAELPVIPLVDGSVDATGARNFSLVAQTGTTNFRSGVATATLGYNGQLLGPALRLRSGEKVALHVQNNLGEDTTVHWHGLLVPTEADGGPHQVIAPGARWTASFTVANPASTCWFHPHTHGSTGRQVVMGLAGLLIVDDTTIAPSTLPDTWGVDDLALVLQDKRFTAAGQVDYTLSASDRTNGYTGDTLLVNGALAPVWQAPRQWVRFRLLNGCNARTLDLRLGNSLSLLQVANEAGLLAVPVARPSLALGPGERAEVLVDFSAMPVGQEVPLYVSAAAGSMGMGNAAGATEVQAMTMRVSLPKQANAMFVAAQYSACGAGGRGGSGRKQPHLQPGWRDDGRGLHDQRPELRHRPGRLQRAGEFGGSLDIYQCDQHGASDARARCEDVDAHACRRGAGRLRTRSSRYVRRRGHADGTGRGADSCNGVAVTSHVSLPHPRA